MTSPKGIQFALFTALISGVSIFVNKFAVSTVGQPLVFTAFKNSLVGILIFGILLATQKWKKISSLSRKNKINLTLIGIIGGSLPFYLFFTGISQIPAINAAMIHKTLVIWVAILAIPMLKEKFNKTQIIAVALLFLSNLVIGGFKGFTFSKGELLILTATILWAVETIIAKKTLSNVDPDIVVAARMGIGAIILVGTGVLIAPTTFNKILSLSLTQWGIVLATAAFLLGYVMSWYRALKHAPAITVTSVLVVSTIVTNVLSAVFVTHSWNSNLTFQAILIFAGLGLFWFADRKQSSILTVTS
jgi:drug/metabolite transporter (DMT)-like permease